MKESFFSDTLTARFVGAHDYNEFAGMTTGPWVFCVPFSLPRGDNLNE